MGFEEFQTIDLNPSCLINQCVPINGYDSSLAAINCSFPQGSVLGSLLFLLSVKNLKQAIKSCKVHHFADDTISE